MVVLIPHKQLYRKPDDIKLTWKFDSLGDWPALVETNIQCHLYVLPGFCHNAHKDLEVLHREQCMLVFILFAMLYI